MSAPGVPRVAQADRAAGIARGSTLSALARFGAITTPADEVPRAISVGIRAGLALVTRVRSTSFRCTGRGPTASPAGRPDWLLCIPLQGAHVLEANGLRQIVRPGTFYLVRLDRDFRFWAAGPSDALYAGLPLALLEGWGFDVDRTCGAAWTASPLAGALVSLIPAARDALTGDPRVETVVEDTVLQSIRALLMTSIDDRGRSRQPATIHGRAMRLIDTLYRDPDLDPRRIAGQLAVSVRQLHRSFQDTDGSVAGMLRMRRLGAAAELLKRTEHEQMSVSQVASAVGFRGSSQFRRAFRDRYGHSPTEFRGLARRS